MATSASSQNHDRVLVYAEYLSRIRSIAISIQLSELCYPQQLTFRDVRTAVLHYTKASGSSDSTTGVHDESNESSKEKQNHESNRSDQLDELESSTASGITDSIELNQKEKSSNSNDNEFIINLPEDITVRVSESTIPISELTSTLSFRLPASPELADVLQTKLNFYDSYDQIPWSADMLNSHKVSFCCVQCDGELVKPNRIKQWKSLPSENWAEMMDFWHCHKPKSEDDNMASKFNPSYAVSKFTPYSGTVLVGDCYFYLFKDDTTARVVGETVACEKCGYDLGTCDASDKTSLTVWKWNLKLVTPDVSTDNTKTKDDIREAVASTNTCMPTKKPAKPLRLTYPLHQYVSTVIARLIDSHAIYTFSITDMDEKPDLLLWVFNPDIKYTTATSAKGQRGFKIVYTYDKKIMPSLEKTRGEIEVVKFPPRVLEVLKAHLVENTLSLPENARSFGQWTVSMLEKIN
ncbi:hypothetical protein AWJ20_535 [Sugiyamaella lignohabitans]|uniref:Uncharacterized protein n=1 Tax=Sugiyamaella lignohabitans TaxID=796027 RepID=A0A167CZB1_9ASCO|nr:uncharacterized protein AWJ20_535 [Sugiyamaella lignohabitans]ANB12286.1 hypothetical protein AWJ20_535 [Sugiyamaella lignohabitans]